MLDQQWESHPYREIGDLPFLLALDYKLRLRRYMVCFVCPALPMVKKVGSYLYDRVWVEVDYLLDTDRDLSVLESDHIVGFKVRGRPG